MRTIPYFSSPVVRHVVSLACGILAMAAHGTSLTAQSPGGRLQQFVLPPSTWRVTLSGEVLAPAGVRDDALRPGDYPKDIGIVRSTARLSMPVWKRGLYTTVVTNDVVYDRFAVSYGEGISTLPTGQLVVPFGPETLQGLQHELGVSHAMTPKWRLTGALQHGLYTSGGSFFEGQRYRASGGAFVSRVYRPTMQVGFGVVALNVAPYVIPTIRVLHVGQKWRTDVLLPRAETFRDVGHGVEVGGVLRFVGNRWDADGAPANLNRFRRVTYQQAMLGPAATLRVGTQGLVQLEGGVALRRMLVEGTRQNPALGFAELPLAWRFDTEAAAQLRLSGRLTF